jgi:hypothetical protein
MEAVMPDPFPAATPADLSAVLGKDINQWSFGLWAPFKVEDLTRLLLVEPALKPFYAARWRQSENARLNDVRTESSNRHLLIFCDYDLVAGVFKNSYTDLLCLKWAPAVAGDKTLLAASPYYRSLTDGPKWQPVIGGFRWRRKALQDWLTAVLGIVTRRDTGTTLPPDGSGSRPGLAEAWRSFNNGFDADGFNHDFTAWENPDFNRGDGE